MALPTATGKNRPGGSPSNRHILTVSSHTNTDYPTISSPAVITPYDAGNTHGDHEERRSTLEHLRRNRPWAAFAPPPPPTQSEREAAAAVTAFLSQYEAGADGWIKEPPANMLEEALKVYRAAKGDQDGESDDQAD